MPTTNIPQILSSILKPNMFSRKDQRLRIMAYTLGLSMPKHVNESNISKYIHISQSSISRTLSTNAISTELITSSRMEDKNGRVILCSDVSKSQDEILEHYSKRTYIELGFKYAKNELGIKLMVYSKTSTLRHVELVSLFFTTWMVSQFWLNVKDRLGLREFIEQIRISCFVVLLKAISKDLSYIQRLESFHILNPIQKSNIVVGYKYGEKIIG